ncbi:MAG: N-acetyl-gamma-glutamyl-phosphate reductase [Candidatus Egerieousia sp.]
MIKAAIVGGTGYTAGETLRILLNHPEVQIASVFSTSCAGDSVSSVHTDLLGETTLKFSDTLGDPDVIFLCLGHGVSREFIDTHEISPDCKIIDLGNDFRLEPEYKGRKFVYGLADTFRDEVKNGHDVANPGCFATAIQSAIAPLAKKELIKDDIHVTAITGATGAGKKATSTTQFSWRDNNISIYKLFRHQHLGEIKRTLKRLTGGEAPEVHFVPMRGDFPRGIFASVYTKWYGSSACISDEAKTAEACSLFKEYYKESPFTFVAEQEISLKDVVNTNKCLLKVQVADGMIHISSMIDNLVKGAAGQAVENMNLLFGLDETTGLKFKPSAF